MKRKSLLSIGFIILILISSLGIYSYMSIKRTKEQVAVKNKIIQEKKDKEIDENLKKLEITPLVENIQSNANTTTGTNIKISSQAQIKQEKIMILSFSTVGECEQLKYLKDRCKEAFLYELATKSGDIEYCSRLKTTSEINNCKDEIFLNKNECNRIIDSYLKEKCAYNKKLIESNQTAQKSLNDTKTLTNDTCKNFSSYSQKESCLKAIILKELNINLCNTFFTNEDEKKSCINNIGYDYNREIILQAYEKKDLSLCDKLTTIELKNQCKNMTF